ncbi:MAG: 2-polyprenylphenol 6-hydroxylase [Pseudomonadota bacterium]
MANPVTNLWHLARAGFVLAQHGVRFFPPGVPVPLPVRIASWLTSPVRALARATRPRTSDSPSEIASGFTALGPSYIKAGQFLAARPDLIGAELAGDLKSLQDRLPPFPHSVAEAALVQELGAPAEALFSHVGPAVAAASIAQVHKATIEHNGRTRDVAVKILRPGVERRFRRDLESFYFAARQIERFHPPSRRLKPVSVVDTIAASTELEMDLRMEAAAISEMAANTREDTNFRVPEIIWHRTAKRVLTIEWIDGIAVNDHAALEAAGHDLSALGMEIIRTFLRHAMRDGFFHADMHQGNILVDHDGKIVLIDFGIMGRLTSREQRYLAEILYGFITQDYRRAAEMHFWAGYVPPHHSVEVFAQALRAIGEPIMDRPAEDISMGHLLGQLLAYTEVFDMETRPELILLQKTMVVVEGVARTLDPKLNIWTAAEPIVKEWMESQLGPAGLVKDARKGAEDVGKFVGELPQLLVRAEQTAERLSEMARDGIRLDETTVKKMAQEQAGHDRSMRIGVWAVAGAIAALVISQVW